MKLKTLKDLHFPKMKWENISRENLCSRRELRKEAIKDIKEFEKQKTSEWTFLYNPTIGEINAIIQYIKWKFNITMEDLNGK